jgi:octaprenyl-diphosphate synthase
MNNTPFFKQVDAVTLEDVKTLSSQDMQAVDTLIRAQLYSDIALIRQVAEYIIHSGGKRLRPMLVVLSAQALGYQGIHHHTLAAVIEFIHTATLLHDDVVDESDLRRGNQTANALFGNAASVLVGDFLYTRAFQMMVSCGKMRVMEILAQATNIIAEGEVLQLMNIGNVNTNEAAYLQVVQYKTAKLFEAAMRLGAILSEASPSIEHALAQYGMHLGTAFQIIDDVLDYTGEEETIGKKVGDDLAEGKPTLPLIYTLAHGTPTAQNLVRQALANADRANIEQILPIMQQSGALEYARQLAKGQSELAKKALALIPASPYKTALLSLAEVALNRNH